MSWRECTLGEVVKLQRGHDLPERNRVEGPVPIVSSSGITGRHNVAKADPPGVVTGRYGTIGEVFYVEEPYWPLNTALYVVDFKGNDPRYVAYLLRNTLKNYKSEKAAVPGVDRNVLHLLKVRAAEIRNQQEIVSILSAYDNLIENNRRRIELLEQMAQAIYREWIVHFRYPGHENDELVDSPLGPIPSAWRSAPLQTVADVRRGLSWEIEREVERSHPDAMSIVTIPDLGNMLTYEAKKLIEAPTTGELARFSISHGDLLLVGSNGNPDRVGHAVWVPAGRQGLFASFVIRVRTDPAAASPILMYHHMRSGRLREWLSAGAVGSTGLRNIRISALREAPTLIPDDKTLHRFEAIADPARALQDTLGAQCDALERCRDLLLPKLVTGEIDVSALDLDGFLEKAEM